MKIGFTYDLKSDYQVDDSFPQDALAEFDAQETIAEIEDALKSGGHHVERIGGVRSLLKRLPDLSVDIVFNICEGFATRNRESEVPLVLDLYRVPYVGSDALTLGMTLDKVMAKKAFVADGVPTPKYFVANGSLSKSALDGLKFPMIVKPRHEGSSKGISEDSVVCDAAALRRQVASVNRTYGQAALVEEFISGQEFTVLVVGNKRPQALSPVRIKILGRLDIGDLVYTSRRVNNDDVEYVCPARTSSALDRKLREVAVAAYQALDCRDFSRVDMRVDKKGRPYVLEINPLPSLSSADVFPLIAEAEGTTYNKLIVRILNEAVERNGLVRKKASL